MQIAAVSHCLFGSDNSKKVCTLNGIVCLRIPSTQSIRLASLSCVHCQAPINPPTVNCQTINKFKLFFYKCVHRHSKYWQYITTINSRKNWRRFEELAKSFITLCLRKSLRRRFAKTVGGWHSVGSWRCLVASEKLHISGWNEKWKKAIDMSKGWLCKYIAKAGSSNGPCDLSFCFMWNTVVSVGVKGNRVMWQNRKTIHFEYVNFWWECVEELKCLKRAQECGKCD